jgi:catechol 2,3-dioxygenase-like lactoylglutathione lyase family enzyme
VQWGTVRVGGAMLNVTNRGVFDVALGVYNGLDHFALRTTDLDDTISTLRANGVNIFLEPMSPKPGVRIAFVSGPDNVKIEILQIDS